MLGHPTGRIILQRPAYEINMDKIIELAAERGIIIEFNSNPYRLDLDWRWCRKAKEKGVLISINPDAHSVGEIDLVKSGVAVARKGWLEASNTFNTWDKNQIEEYFLKRKIKA